jgi:hypothetical protein
MSLRFPSEAFRLSSQRVVGGKQRLIAINQSLQIINANVVGARSKSQASPLS